MERFAKIVNGLKMLDRVLNTPLYLVTNFSLIAYSAANSFTATFHFFLF